MFSIMFAAFVALSLAVYVGTGITCLNIILYDFLLAQYGKPLALLLAAGVPFLIIILILIIMKKNQKEDNTLKQIIISSAFFSKLGFKTGALFCIYEALKFIRRK